MPTMPSRLLDLREVSQLVGLGKSAIYDWIGRGLFPRPVQLGPRTVRWPEAEVLAWIAARIAERDAVRPSKAA
jgi:prophage regulatory protein